MGDLARLASDPSEHQRTLWWQFIAIKDEPVQDANGAYMWMGWCPLCDESHDVDDLSARFDFRRGLLYCDNGDDGRACHGHRSMSLTNVMMRMASSGQR